MKSIFFFVSVFLSVLTWATPSVFICKTSSAADASTVIIGPLSEGPVVMNGNYEHFGWKAGQCNGGAGQWRSAKFTANSLQAEGECGAHGSCPYISLKKQPNQTWVGTVIMIGAVTCNRYVTP